jgi:hypothetical protein
MSSLCLVHQAHRVQPAWTVIPDRWDIPVNMVTKATVEIWACRDRTEKQDKVAYLAHPVRKAAKGHLACLAIRDHQDHPVLEDHRLAFMSSIHCTLSLFYYAYFPIGFD